jgi:hypothetical protein
VPVCNAPVNLHGEGCFAFGKCSIQIENNEFIHGVILFFMHWIALSHRFAFPRTSACAAQKQMPNTPTLLER